MAILALGLCVGFAFALASVGVYHTSVRVGSVGMDCTILGTLQGVLV